MGRTESVVTSQQLLVNGIHLLILEEKCCLRRFLVANLVNRAKNGSLK
jgi:hypothetical protein